MSSPATGVGQEAAALNQKQSQTTVAAPSMTAAQTNLEEMQERVSELDEKFRMLSMENDMLADYLQREAEKGSGFDDTEESAADLPQQAERGRKGQPQRGGRAGQQQRAQARLRTSLTLEEKLRIANQELEALQEGIENTKKTSEQNLEILRALMEETDIRTREVKRDAYEFRRDIVVGAENPRTGKTIADKVLKYMEDKLTQKDMLINKLLTKNQAFKIAIKKAENQLKSKSETGDDLQYIDFHQLQIENQELLQRIEDATQELLDLKKKSGRTQKQLGVMKKSLASLTAEVKTWEDEIRERRALLDKTEKDIVKVVEEKETARKDHKKLRAQRTSSQIPQVVDYVTQKAEEYQLEAQKRDWERKVELAANATKRVRMALRASGTMAVTAAA